MPLKTSSFVYYEQYFRATRGNNTTQCKFIETAIIWTHREPKRVVTLNEVFFEISSRNTITNDFIPGKWSPFDNLNSVTSVKLRA